MFVLPKQVAHKWKNLSDYFWKELKKVPLTRRRSSKKGRLALLKDQFLPRTSHSNLPYTDDETTIATISTPGEVNEKQNEDEEEDASQEVENLSESVNDIDQCATPSLRSESEPRPILKNRCRKRKSDMDGLLELENQKITLLREKYNRLNPPSTNTIPVYDEDKSFFVSLLPHVRQIQPRLKLLFRNEVQNLVHKYVYEQNCDASTHSRIPCSTYTSSAAEISSMTPQHEPQQMHNSSSPILQTSRTPHLVQLETVEASNSLNTYNFQHSSENIINIQGNLYLRRVQKRQKRTLCINISI
nr:unnamed protein product [Callosobruchus analis]